MSKSIAKKAGALLVAAVTSVGTWLTSASASEVDIKRNLAQMPQACADTSTEAGAQSCGRILLPLAMDSFEYWNNVGLAGRASDTFVDMMDRFSGDGYNLREYKNNMREFSLRTTHRRSLKEDCGPLSVRNQRQAQRFNFGADTDRMAQTIGGLTRQCFGTILDGARQFPQIKTALKPADLQAAYKYADCLANRKQDCASHTVAGLEEPAREKPRGAHRKDDGLHAHLGAELRLGGPFRTAMNELGEKCGGDLSDRAARIQCMVADSRAMKAMADGLRIHLEGSLENTDEAGLRRSLQTGIESIGKDCTKGLARPELLNGTFEDLLEPNLEQIQTCAGTMYFMQYGEVPSFEEIVVSDPSGDIPNDRYTPSLRHIAAASLKLREAQAGTTGKAAPGGGGKGLKFNVR